MIERVDHNLKLLQALVIYPRNVRSAGAWKEEVHKSYWDTLAEGFHFFCLF